MGIKRGPDGVPIDIPSTRPRDDGPTEDTKTKPGTRPSVSVNFGDEPTIKGGSVKPPADFESEPPGGSPRRQSLFLDEPPTVVADQTSNTTVVHPEPELTDPLEEPKTQVARGRKSIGSVGPEAITPDEGDAMRDPVAGWLVVIAGAGKGRFLPVGYGQNTIGRGAGERVPLDFGDMQVSRSGHCVVTYDPRGRQFYIQPGTGTNLTYLDDGSAPVLQPMVLKPFAHIHIGETVLRFVPLCGEGFNWESTEE